MRLLITNPYDYEPDVHIHYQAKRLFDEAKKFDVIKDIALISKFDLRVEINDKGAFVLFKEEPLDRFDIIIPRGNFMDRLHFSEGMLNLIEKNNIRLLNKDSFKFLTVYNKINQMFYLHDAGIRVPASYIYAGADELLKNADPEKLIKPSMGSLGNNIALASREFILKLLTTEQIKPSELLVQEKLPNRTDYRVLVLNGESLGVMKKVAAEKQLVSNYSAGGSISQEDNAEVSELGIRAAKVMHCEYAGVDIMYDDQHRPVVLEVNRNAAFEGFEKATGVNVAEKIIQHLLKK